jgi:hypothetical protein
VVVITAIVAGLLVLVYRVICSLENRRRDKMGTVEGFEHAYEDDLTDKMVSDAISKIYFHSLTDRQNMQFRYSL